MSQRIYEFKEHENPTVTIISLLYNKSHLTEQYLESLIKNVSISFQLILLDNASSDDTSQLLDRVRGAIVLRSNANLQFIKGNNLAAVAATGKYLLFLNNDTEVHAGTVESMVKTLESDPTCYGVASKIIFPTGLLQEAGSIIWRNGSCYGYGRGQLPNLPEFNYRREVDYGSAACLLVRHDKFVEVGGFDNRYAPAYYEDTDLCMKLRQAGGKIIYDPNAIIVHHEYSSSSPEAAIAKMQVRQVIFEDKWKQQLVSHALPDIANALNARDRHTGKTLLYIDDRIPTPDQGSGWPRAFNIIKVLSAFYKITVFPKQHPHINTHWTKTLQEMGVECINDGRSFEEFCEQRKDFYDIIFASRPHNLEQCIDYIKSHQSNAKIVYDAEALFYARERIKRQLLNVPEDASFLEAIQRELKLLDHADMTILVSEGEIQTVLSERLALGFNKPKNLQAIGHSIDPNTTTPSFDQRKDILFIGAFHGQSTPNEDAMLYFIDQIFPLITERLNCRLLIAGPTPPQSLLDRQQDNIKIIGFVEDITPLYESARVFIIPHRYAGGIAWKLSETMSMGLPSVCSQLIAGQFGFDDNGPVLIGRDPQDFADKVVQLYNEPLLWEAKRNAAYDYIRDTHCPNVLDQKLITIMQSL
jgi:GT2 family glycosyltransferase